LPTLLSHALVAFTIEFDNEFDHQMPHRTTHLETKHGSATDARDAPWLVSLLMWSNYMRFVGEDGTRLEPQSAVQGGGWNDRMAKSKVQRRQRIAANRR